jgi:hypothetical protein
MEDGDDRRGEPQPEEAVIGDRFEAAQHPAALAAAGGPTANPDPLPHAGTESAAREA